MSERVALGPAIMVDLLDGKFADLSFRLNIVYHNTMLGSSPLSNMETYPLAVQYRFVTLDHNERLGWIR